MAYDEHGVYRTAVDRKLSFASTVVVSALMPATREVFPGQRGGYEILRPHLSTLGARLVGGVTAVA